MRNLTYNWIVPASSPRTVSGLLASSVSRLIRLETSRVETRNPAYPYN